MIGLLLLAAATQMPNTVALPGCVEATCTITASSAPGSYQFGVGTTWCATAIASPKLPMVVNYSIPNPVLCATDPAAGVTKSLVAIKQTVAYTVTYSIGGKIQPVVTVPALPVTPPVNPPTTPTVIWVGTCTMTELSDLSFKSSNCVKTGP